MGSLSSGEADPYLLNVAFGGYTSPYSYPGLGYASPSAYGYAAPAAPLASVGQAGHGTPTAYTAPVAPAVTTHDKVPAPAKAASVTSSQFHAQDEEGNYSFGYKNPNSARQETGNALTGVSGSYSDGYHTYNYIADLGFRRV